MHHSDTPEFKTVCWVHREVVGADMHKAGAQGMEASPLVVGPQHTPFRLAAEHF